MEKQAERCMRDLRACASLVRAKASQRFFKTGPGEYGAGDVCIGITVPDIRRVAAAYGGMPLSYIALLLKHSVHEFRLCALILMVNRYKKASHAEQKRLYTFFVQYIRHVNNWDLVDSSAPQIVGHMLFEHISARERRKVLRVWLSDSSLWVRRIAVVSTLYGIRMGVYADTLFAAKYLLHDKNDLIHKASGWMLREMGKRNTSKLVSFLNTNASSMPRTMLRYAIERLTKEDRARYMHS
jgi:3-methyladenine DNA glycosylase AlkD